MKLFVLWLIGPLMLFILFGPGTTDWPGDDNDDEPPSPGSGPFA